MRKTLFTAALLLGALTSANASVNTDAAKTNYTDTQWEYYAAAEKLFDEAEAQSKAKYAHLQKLVKLYGVED